MEELTRRGFVRLAGGAAALGVAGSLSSFLDACGGSQVGTPRPVEADVSKLYQAAKKEGTVTWWTSQFDQGTAEMLAGAFQKKFPGIEVNLLRQTAQVINTRLQQDLKAGVNDCDVFSSTDEAHYPPLKKANALATYRPPDVNLIPKELQQFDPDEQWHLGAIAFVIVNFRSDKVPSPPARWQDLLDAQWKGKITTGHPGFSGIVGNWVVAMLDKYGDQYLRGLAKNQPKVNRSVFDTVTDLLNGDRVVGAGPDSLSLAKKAGGSPIDIQWPADDAIMVASPIGILAKAPHPNAARLYTNFVYSREFSNALVATYNYPIRTDVSLPRGVPPLTQIKYYRNKSDRLVAGIDEAKAKWRELIGA